MKIKDVIRIIRSLESDCEPTGVRQQETSRTSEKKSINMQSGANSAKERPLLKK